MFDMIQQPSDHSWNSMFSAYLQYGYLKEALELLGLMLEDGKVTHELTLINILHVCARQEAEMAGKQVHTYIVSESLESSNVNFVLIVFYAKLKRVWDTLYVFDTASECPTTDAWNAMISAWLENGHEKQAFQSFQQMLQECSLPNKATVNSIRNVFLRPWDSSAGKFMHYYLVLLDSVSNGYIDSLAQFNNDGSFDMAQSLFDRVPDRSVDAWKVIIAAASRSGKLAEGINLILQMQSEGVLGDKVVILFILDACARESCLGRGKQMHVMSVGLGCDEDVSLGTCLVNMYGRCGSLAESLRVFYELPERNLLTWTCMIAVLAQHGQGFSAIELFSEMQLEGMVPDKVTFTSVLSACARSGLPHTGAYYLISMSNIYGIFPVSDHFNCISDLLGKSCQLVELKAFVENIPVQPTATTWTIALDACRMLSDVTHADGHAKQLFEVELEDATPYVALSTAYVAAYRDVASKA